jgi:hypothetical protein
MGKNIRKNTKRDRAKEGGTEKKERITHFGAKAQRNL